jgi:hypothetical protein
MHVDTNRDKAALPQGGESGTIEDVSAKCTQICGESFTGRSCSMTLLLTVFPKNHPEQAVRVMTKVT